MTETLRHRLEELVTEYTISGHAWQRSLASRFGAVPLHADEAGCVLLAPTGQWVFVYANQDWVATVEFTHDVSEEWKALALEAAAERHPELLALLP